MATLAERIALAEEELHRAAEETQLAYRTYHDANAVQTRISDELKDLRRQQRSMTERIAIARRELEDAAEETRACLDESQRAEAEGRRSDASSWWKAHMDACHKQDQAQARLDELERL